jgi:hypothetical protein
MKQFGISMLSAIVLLTVASAPWSGQQDSGSYDPWLDYDENGVINARELYRLGESYGSLGNTTRNVTIAGHVTAYLRPGGEQFSIPGESSWFSDMISVDGYATVTVLIWASPTSNFEGHLNACDNSGYSWVVENIVPVSNNWVKTYDVMNQRVQIYIRNGGLTAITVEVAVYLVA